LDETLYNVDSRSKTEGIPDDGMVLRTRKVLVCPEGSNLSPRFDGR